MTANLSTEDHTQTNTTLLDRAARHAAEADRSGYLHSTVVEALHSSAIPAHFIGPRYGGGPGDFTSITRTISDLAHACPATAWLAAVAAYNARFAGFLPQQGQDEIWGDANTALIASGLVPAGHAELTDTGDYRLSGTWKHVSGVESAQWVLLVAMTQQSTTVPYLFAVPRRQITVRSTWNALGMRATASHTVNIDTLEVPAHRATAHLPILTGAASPSSPAGPAHSTPLMALGGLTFLAPAYGAADELARLLTRRTVGQARAADKPVPESVSLALGHAAAAIDATRQVMNAITSDLDAGSGRDRAAVNAQRAAYAATLLREAMATLLPIIGTADLAEHTDTQRLWRDVTVAVSHAALNFTKATTAYVGSIT
ncbi:acyl-CoA dehydrogenase family protein [Nocardia alba]|uniref:Two-component flavin-dependent monooxygenase n=1 Tax=Nocardia alba TaxID=225051 RepID=A0A4R1FAS9_9NOCA|nr:acyl-CoA dehydrogenase family protein [Nocardia alba]TCJ89902.1 two-component flavin-dependent monooxygenase [Nocardia alba]